MAELKVKIWKGAPIGFRLDGDKVEILGDTPEGFDAEEFTNAVKAEVPKPPEKESDGSVPTDD